MASDQIARLLLGLYPASFRRRFRHEWAEIVRWRWEAARRTRFGSIRAAVQLTFDTVRSLPAAYMSVSGDRFARMARRRGGEGDVGQGGGSLGGPAGGPRGFVESWRGDIRYAFRGLMPNRGFALAAVSSLALGVGANTAIFSVVNAVLLQPLPYQEPDRLAIVWNEFTSAGLARLPVSGVELQALRDHPDLFDDVAGIWATSRTMMTDDGPEVLSVALITPNFFSVLGVPPRLGRSFAEDETGTPVPPGVILSDEFWRSRFGADPSVLEQGVRLESAESPVVGVAPPEFALFFPPDGGIPERVDVFLPLPWNLNVLPPDQHFLRVIGRLGPDPDWARAQEQVSAVAERVRQQYTAIAATGDEFTIVPLHGDAVRAARPALLALLGAVGLFLLLAAANVASLVLARTTTRGREMAIRVAMGASNRRLVQLLTAETTIITVLGGALGLWLGHQGGRVLWALRPEGVARVDAIALDGSVLGFTLVACALAGLVTGLAPLAHVTGMQPVRNLRVGSLFTSRASRRARKVVTGGEVALGLVLVIGAALLAQTFARLQTADVGFDPADRLTFKVSLSLQRFPEDVERARLAKTLEDRLREIPGVVTAGAGSHLPFATWANWGSSGAPEGVAENDREAFFVDHRSVTPGYFTAIGARLVSGRFFEESDDLERSRVVIVDRTWADRIYPGVDPVGRRVFASQYVHGEFVNGWATIVGVIDDIRDRSPSRPSPGQLYWPYAQSARWELTYVVRGDGDLAALIPLVRAEVQAVERDLAASEFRRLDALAADATRDASFVAVLSAVFSALAVLLAALGLYSVITYSTTQRLHEMGLRLALGATAPDLVRSVLAEGVRLGASGIAVGLVAAWGLTRFLNALLFEVDPTDPVTFGFVATMFLAIALLASLGPALRATRTDPVEAMRGG